MTACKALQAWAEFLKVVATGLERENGITCPDFQLHQVRYLQFTQAMAALSARVTALHKQFQREARDGAVVNQEAQRDSGHLSAHPC